MPFAAILKSEKREQFILHLAEREQPSDRPEPMNPRQCNDLRERLLRDRLVLTDRRNGVGSSSGRNMKL
ncbi:MAG: hypothetical protein P8Y42_17290 [Exilibacterium sp.]